MLNKPQFRVVTPLVPTGGDLASSVGYFVAQLGFTCLWQGDGRAGIQRGDVHFILVENDDAHWAEHACFSIGVDDLDVLYREFQHVAGDLGSVGVMPWGRREFHMILPSGVCLQFYQASAAH